ncbi:MAG: ABC transporter permease DevC [Rickettsiales bacterium]
MSLTQRFYFALRLAWRQLTYERGKLIAALLGVMFACVLVFMQLGFKDSLYESISTVVKRLSGDIFIMHKQTEALWRTVPFERSELLRAFASPAVKSATPLYIGQAQWKNPATQTKRTLLVWASEPTEMLLQIPELTSYNKQLTRENTVAFDELSRPEFGPVKDLMAKGPVITEINDRKMEVVTTFKLGASFAADGNLITSDQNFFRIFPNRNMNQVDVGVIRLKSGSDILGVQKELRALLNENVHVFTLKEIVAYEFAYWQNNAPIGFIFGFGTVMGLVVGMVIVYQILFTDITNHLNEFATLKAMGYAHRYLIMVVFGSSLILAVIGFVPGFLLSLGLYRFAETVTFIPMPMPLTKVLMVFLMILTMCVVAGSLAMRKMRQANPADMF